MVKQGFDDSQIEKEMKKWELNHEEVLKARSAKKEHTNKEKNIKNDLPSDEEE